MLRCAIVIFVMIGTGCANRPISAEEQARYDAAIAGGILLMQQGQQRQPPPTMRCHTVYIGNQAYTNCSQ